MGKPKPPIIWKTKDRKTKRTEIWESAVLEEHMYYTFDLAWGNQNPQLSGKRRIVKRNGLKSGNQWYSKNICVIPLTL